MAKPKLQRLTPDQLPSLRRDPVDAETIATVMPILEAVKSSGETALREYAEGFGDIKIGEALVIDRAGLMSALEKVDSETRSVLERCALRVQRFAEAQLASLGNVAIAIPGGYAGHASKPVDAAGCYAPGGRFPLPSSVLMTAVTARTAGVKSVVVASPKPTIHTLAAAAVAGADMLLAVGGAQAIAALAYGAGAVPACDVIVGPGNRFVTAAKKLVVGTVAIDMLAGPSELVVLADDTADPALVAADLLAQAEHDPEAFPSLVTPSASLADAVDTEISKQLATLTTADTASAAVAHGATVIVSDIAEGLAVCDRLAPEHLEIMTKDAESVAARATNYGGLFIGSTSGEVLGDYCAGPNHVLPTGATSRYTGGLSVFHFLRTRTWMRIDDDSEARQLMQDAVTLARIEGLEGHARAAEKRLKKS